jgi:hypothetical protein
MNRERGRHAGAQAPGTVRAGQPRNGRAAAPGAVRTRPPHAASTPAPGAGRAGLAQSTVSPHWAQHITVGPRTVTAEGTPRQADPPAGGNTMAGTLAGRPAGPDRTDHLPAGAPAPHGVGNGRPHAGAGRPAGISGTAATARTRWRTAARQLTVLGAYLAVGAAVTWPRLSYLVTGRLPATRDAGGYVWGFWWVAHQVITLGNPWHTYDLAAPVGTQLGYHTLMPLPGVVMTPITLTLGPSVSYNLLSAVCPGVLAYAMYRAAKLWLPTGMGAYAAGALYGFSPILAWRSWYEVNLALGALFFPLALAAAVRFRRNPGIRRALVLGVVVGASMLTDQESAVMTVIVTVLALAPWLIRQRRMAPVLATCLAGVVSLVVAAPQLVAMLQAAAGGWGQSTNHILAIDYVYSGAGLEQFFAPSPRLASMGLPALAQPYYNGGPASQVIVGYGVILTALALAGLALCWHSRAARLLGLLWLAATVLALGSTVRVGQHRYVPLAQTWHGVRVSLLLPFTWFVRLPGLAGFREADRFTEVALLGAALLGGAAAGWLFQHAKPVLITVAALAVLEMGWSGNPPRYSPIGTMPAALPALANPIRADRSGSIVVAVPFGLRGGLPVLGRAFPPQTLVLATEDGHPLADAFVSRIPEPTRRHIRAEPFYRALLLAQGSSWRPTRSAVAAAAHSAEHMRIGWVVDWMWRNRDVSLLLARTGFRRAYRADGAWVYRRVGSDRSPATEPAAGVSGSAARSSSGVRPSSTVTFTSADGSASGAARARSARGGARRSSR